MRVTKLLVGLLIALHVFLPFHVLAKVPPIPDEDGYVFDYSDVLSEDVINRLNNNSRALEEATGAQIVILTIDTIGNMEPAEFGTKVIREWGIGKEGLNNGVLIYTTTKQGEGKNDVWISVGQGLEGALPDGKLGRYIDEYMLSHLSDGDFDYAFESVYRVIYDDVSAEYGWENENYEEVTLKEMLPFLILLGIIIIIIIYILFKYGKNNSDDDFGGSGGSRSRRWTVGGHIGGNSFGSGGGSSGGFSGGGGSSGGGGAGRNF